MLGISDDGIFVLKLRNSSIVNFLLFFFLNAAFFYTGPFIEGVYGIAFQFFQFVTLFVYELLKFSRKKLLCQMNQIIKFFSPKGGALTKNC